MNSRNTRMLATSDATMLAAWATFTLALLPAAVRAQSAPPADPFAEAYSQACAACHGANMEGTPRGFALTGRPLQHGDSVDAIARSIAEGFGPARMPAFSGTMDAVAIRRLATWIAESRADLSYADFRIAAPPTVPAETVRSQAHSFRIQTHATGLTPLPYSIAPLPDGDMLLAEKTGGLRIVARDGRVSDPVRNTPKTFNDGFQVPGILLVYGMGYLLDVALHPEYAKNGWIYLAWTERCSDCNAASRKSGQPASMVMLVRGRIRDGEWLDQQTIWQTDRENYTSMPDMAAGGRVTFDGKGHVFLSIGIKGGSEFAGIQDLSLPYGKILRVNDDGSIPQDNPFTRLKGALPEIWTYGHRSPEGLEFDRRTGRLWQTEMGQRGGDELNLLRAGRNYGWPLTSRGLRYEGIPVEYGRELGIAFDLKDIEQPVVDLTPAPAVSSLVVYDGMPFAKWRGNLLVGTLKATELYRFEVRGDRIGRRETLLKGLGRIRDVAVGPDGLVYLLLEHQSGSRILKLVPAS